VSAAPSRQYGRDSLRKLPLLVDLGLVTPVAKRLWRAFDTWDDAAPSER
jgi:hypothetical protein